MMREMSQARQDSISRQLPAADKTILAAKKPGQAVSAGVTDPPLPSVRGAFSFRHRGLMGVLLLAPVSLAILASRPLIPAGSLLNLLLNGAGWVFFLLYVTFRVWATIFVGGRKDSELQTDGPYSLCRNPLYVGSLFFALSLACFLGSISFLVVFAAAFGFYNFWVVRAEEYFLEQRFDEDYRNYCRRTPRFWLRLASFNTPQFVRVDLRMLKKEAGRLWRAALAPIALEIIMHLRATADWWPDWFTLP